MTRIPTDSGTSVGPAALLFGSSLVVATLGLASTIYFYRPTLSMFAWLVLVIQVIVQGSVLAWDLSQYNEYTAESAAINYTLIAIDAIADVRMCSRPFVMLYLRCCGLVCAVDCIDGVAVEV